MMDDRVQCSKTDLIVVVGSGTQMKEFECHAAIFSLVLSKLFAASSARLLLQHMKPYVWELFWDHNDPCQNGSTLKRSCSTILIQWFKEFDMVNYLKHFWNIIKECNFHHGYDFFWKIPWSKSHPAVVQAVVQLVQCTLLRRNVSIKALEWSNLIDQLVWKWKLWWSASPVNSHNN